MSSLSKRAQAPSAAARSVKMEKRASTEAACVNASAMAEREPIPDENPRHPSEMKSQRSLIAPTLSDKPLAGRKIRRTFRRECGNRNRPDYGIFDRGERSA